ncbi:MAG: hypothetical protein IPL08_12850 [Saprospiraceae bacterium]|nr:hypothetical protein [Saprospiraceae bacterium]
MCWIPKRVLCFQCTGNSKGKTQENTNLYHFDRLRCRFLGIKTKKRKISDITSTSVSGQTKCRILFNLANHYACHSILELGTSLGISSAYLASANHTSEIVTMEGDPNIAAVATDVHQTLGLKNIQIVTGIFENTLSKTLDHFEHLDLVLSMVIMLKYPHAHILKPSYLNAMNRASS